MLKKHSTFLPLGKVWMSGLRRNHSVACLLINLTYIVSYVIRNKIRSSGRWKGGYTWFGYMGKVKRNLCRKCFVVWTRLSRQKRTIFTRVYIAKRVYIKPTEGWLLSVKSDNQNIAKRFRNAIATYIWYMHISIQTTHLTPNYPNLPHCLLSMYPRRHTKHCTDFIGGLRRRQFMRFYIRQTCPASPKNAKSPHS